MITTAETVEVALYYDHDCPLVEPLRADLLAALGAAGLDWPIRDHVDEGRLSPTLLIDGVDVLDAEPPGNGCRMQRPSRDRIVEVLERHQAGVVGPRR